MEPVLAWAAEFGAWKNSPAVADVAIGRLREAFCVAAEEETGSTGFEVEVADLIGVTRVVANAKLTLAPPAGEVTGTGAGIAGAVEEFMAESSQALIHPW